MSKMKLPRLMLAGTGGDCGKTLAALGLAALWRRDGILVAPFKKGPDYIDPSWLALAAGNTARNLDTWMMGPKTAVRSFLQNAVRDGINLVEGNRGLYDGEDIAGTHSSAELSKLLKIPVVVVVPTVKVTRTAAALALGLRVLDPDVSIAGIILNRVATSRQEAVIRASVEECSGLPVVGAIPRIAEELLPNRHLGLITPEEHHRSQKAIAVAAEILSKSVDLARLRSIAEQAVPLESESQNQAAGPGTGRGLKIGFFQSPAFTFYYPENLESIDRSGALRIPVDPLNDGALPKLDALYIGGGFPETHAASLSANVSFRNSVAEAARAGLPIWAECGGLIFLCRSVRWKGRRYAMAGVFPIDVALGQRPAGHGYEEVVVDQLNPFTQEGTVLRGHEFHYSQITSEMNAVKTIFRVKRGTGLGNGRDGMISNNVVATYLHLHVLGAGEWITGVLNAAVEYAQHRR